MPLYTSKQVNPGIIPVKDQNAVSPQVAETADEPDFLEGLYDQLAAVRKELSSMWTKYMGRQMNTSPYNPDEPNAIEARVEYERARERLERQEAELATRINEYAYVASLSVNDHDADDEALTPAEAPVVAKARTPAKPASPARPDRY